MAVPIRALLHRFAFVFLVLAAFALMMLGKAETILFERVRSGVVDVVAPIMDALSRPMATVSSAVDDVGNLANMRSENERLRRENARLLQWQTAARTLQAENDSLRKLLNFTPDPKARFTGARIIADSGGVFVRSMLVNAGRRQGVVKGLPVVTGTGLVGRVAGVGAQSARVLLITDINSRIPVVFEKSRKRAILAGDNSDMPRLAFTSRDGAVEVGDRLVTSGHGGMFPPGLPIGIVAEIGESGIRIKPFVDLSGLEYVRIVEYPQLPRFRSDSEQAPAEMKAWP